jgi:serine/threonine protein phosphatase PrpC
MKFNYFSKTVVGLVRKANEDSIGSITKPNEFNLNLRIVCDGMGGHIGGAKASKIAVESIREYFSNNPNPVPQIALKEAITFANLQIFASAQAEPEFKGMGTTCAVLLEIEGLIYIAHVGDSRIYIHTDHKLYRVTKDHSYVQDLVDKGEITDQQMETHPNKNQLTRALGIADRVEVDVVSKPILAKSGDYFMLCSDGLSGLINDRMINSVLKTEDSIETMVNNLITMAEAAGGHDNISVDLIEILESEHIKTQFVNKNNEDLIDTKTQKIVIDNKNQNKKTVNYNTNKLVIVSVLIALSFISYHLFWDNLSAPEIIEEQEVEKIPTAKIDTIKVITEKGWGTSQLNSKFETEVKNIVKSYCKNCPLFYRKGNNEPISIHKYRNDIKKLNVGDYLMVTLTDSKIDMPEINKNIKNEEDNENMFSSVEKKIEEEKRKVEEQQKAKEKDSLEKQKNIKKIKLGPIDLEINNSNSTKNNHTDKKQRKKNKDKKKNSKSDLEEKENDSLISKEK